TSIFSHPVYLFLREFSLQDFRGGSKHVNALDIFTHSYPEIYAGVALTIAGAGGNDEQAMYNVTQEAARILHEAETKD
ncbi:hypothetical protein, partial [Escherichia coli]|uniref:hypothetical protein n=1 Tax=Escherichia coli TaxID=562 RepID=UPI001FCF1C8F